MTPVARYMQALDNWLLHIGQTYEFDLIDELDTMWYALTNEEQQEIDRLLEQQEAK